MQMDPFEDINMAVDSEQHRRRASEKEAFENSTVDLCHFAFFAFGDRSRKLHWTRKNEDIETLSSGASQLIPQHNYKLDVHALNNRRPSCFKQSPTWRGLATSSLESYPCDKMLHSQKNWADYKYNRFLKKKLPMK